jgi:hypothetical protein
MRGPSLQTRALLQNLQGKKLHDLLVICDRYNSACYGDDLSFLNVLKSLKIPGFNAEKFFYSRADVATMSDREAALRAIVKGYTLTTQLGYFKVVGRPGQATAILYEPKPPRDAPCYVFKPEGSTVSSVFFGSPDADQVMDDSSITKLIKFMHLNGLREIEELGQDIDYKFSTIKSMEGDAVDIQGAGKSVFDIIKSLFEMVLSQRSAAEITIEGQLFSLSKGMFTAGMDEPVRLFGTIEECELFQTAYTKTKRAWQYRYDFQTLEEWHSYIEGLNAGIAYKCIFDYTNNTCSVPEFANFDHEVKAVTIRGMLPGEDSQITLLTYYKKGTQESSVQVFVCLPKTASRDVEGIASDIAHWRKTNRADTITWYDSKGESLGNTKISGPKSRPDRKELQTVLADRDIHSIVFKKAAGDVVGKFVIARFKFVSGA